MDTTDQKLLSLLRDNARMSVAAMAKVLGVARGTVQTDWPDSRLTASSRAIP